MPKKSLQIFLMCLVASLIPSVLSECAEGCIKCGTNSSGATACEICDLFSSYYKDSDGKCVRREIDNCLIPSADQNEYYCAQCKMGYILDPENAKCVEVPSNKMVQNCRQYTLVGTCKHCYQHYFLDGNVCSRASVIIDNCRTYFGDDLCQECIDNYYFDVETNTCVSFTPIEKCKSHTFKVCKSCEEGFHKNPNSMMLHDIDTEFVQQYATNLWEGVNFSKTWMSTCMANKDENCLEMEESAASGKLTNNCKTCKTGFYLDQGECKENPAWMITNCEEYLSTNLCKKCSNDFYLDCNECKQRSTYTSCLENDWNKDQCFRCEDTHYLDSSGNCQSRSNGGVEQCSKYTRTMDLCETCNEGFLLTSDMLECYAQIPNCDDYPEVVLKSDLRFTCDSCESDHYLTQDKLNCFEQNVEHCDDYDGDTNVCDSCTSDYYLDRDNNKCLPRTALYCDGTYSEEDKCTQCENLYKRDDNLTTCSPINIPDCLQNDTDTEQCEKCAPQRYLEDDQDRTICVAVVETLEVDDCQYSTSESSTNGCSVCNHMSVNPISLNNNKVVPMSLGCESMTDSVCNKCKEGFNVDSVSFDDLQHHICSQNSSTTNQCTQLRNNRKGTLDESRGICETCKNTDTHYLLRNTCWERTPAFAENCSSFNSIKEECSICKEGFSAKESDANEGPICFQNPDGFTAMTGCLMYNIWDPSRCVKCDLEHILQENGLCIEKTVDKRKLQPVSYFSQNTGILQGSYFLNQKRVSSFTWDLFASYSILNTLSCMDGNHMYVTNKNFGYIVGKGGIYADNYTQECVEEEKWAQKDDGSGGKTPYVTEAECEHSYVISDTLFCFKCKNNMNPKFVAAKYSGTGEDIHSSGYATVESCTTTADSVILSKNYNSATYRREYSSNFYQNFEFEIVYDTCPNSNDNLVVIMSMGEIIEDKFKVNINQTQPVEKSFCYDFGSSPPVQNCYVFGVSFNSDLSTNYRTQQMHCISCKPGFTATLEDNSDGRKISACTPIENCDTSDPTTNTWMNACETCATDHVHLLKIYDSQSQIDISQCVPRTITNCAIQEEDTGKCALCQTGFILESSDTVCSPAPSMDNCDTLSWNAGQLKTYDLTGGSNLNQKFAFLGYIQKLYGATAAKEKCAQCSNDHSLMNVPYSGSTFQCVDNSTLTGLTENCKIFSGLEENKCIECVSTHIVDTDGNCVLKSSLDSTVYIDNCAVLDASSDPNKCDSCLTDFHLNSSTFECVQYDHCTAYSTSSEEVVCDACVDGKMVDYRDKTLCIDIIIPNCKIYDETNKNCSRCDTGYTRIQITNQSDSSKPSYCVKDEFSDTSLNGLAVIKLYSYTNGTMALDSLGTDDSSMTVSSDSDLKRSPSICPRNLLPGCETINNRMICTDCKDGYWEDNETNMCIPNTIPNCKVQMNLYECNTCFDCNHCHDCSGATCDGCDTCTESFFVNSIGQCQKQNVDDCVEFLWNAAGCSVCDHAHYLNEDKCYPHTVDNCQDYESNSDECSLCNSFYYISDGKCVAHTVSGCQEYDTHADECDTCHERYYKSSGQCLLNMATNCDEYRSDSARCSSCITSGVYDTHEGNFIFDGSNINCIPMEEIEGCKLYDEDDGDCDECVEGYIKENGKCVLNPSGVRYCEIFASPSVCTKCIPDYFIDSATSTCKNIYTPIEKCVDYTSQTECKECEDGWMLSSDNTACIQITVSDCKQVLTFDSCEVCNPGFVLVESDQMSSDNTNKIKECENEVDHCIDIVSNETTSDRTDVHGNVKIIKSYTYTCNACSTGYILSDDKTSCDTTVLISNCYEYVKNDDGVTCGQCNMGYWLSKDKKSCIQDYQLIQNGCKDGYMSDEVLCNLCDAGYIMNDSGECVECGGTGCAVCDPTSSSKCSLCSAGYYMNSSKVCSKNPNFSFSLQKEEIAGGDPINKTNRVVVAEEGSVEGDENFGMKLSALVLGLVTLLVGFI